MSGATGGRVPPIHTSVHARSMSRSSSANGSVPSSPKTHEFIHFDEEPASKEPESLSGGSPITEAEPKETSNDVEEPVVAAKTVEEPIKTDAEPEQAVEAHEHPETASDAPIVAQEEAEPVSTKEDITVPNAEDLAVSQETSQDTPAELTEPSITKVTTTDVSEPEEPIPSEMQSATAEDTPAHDHVDEAKKETEEAVLVEQNGTAPPAVTTEEPHAEKIEETGHEETVAVPASAEVATAEDVEETPSTAADESVHPVVEKFDEIEATQAPEESTHISEPATADASEEVEPEAAEKAEPEEPAHIISAAPEAAEAAVEAEPVETVAEEASPAHAEEKAEEPPVPIAADTIVEPVAVVEDVVEPEAAEPEVPVAEPEAAPSESTEVVEPATEPASEETEEAQEAAVAAPEPEEQTVEGVAVSDVPETALVVEEKEAEEAPAASIPEVEAPAVHEPVAETPVVAAEEVAETSVEPEIATETPEAPVETAPEEVKVEEPTLATEETIPEPEVATEEAVLEPEAAIEEAVSEPEVAAKASAEVIEPAKEEEPVKEEIAEEEPIKEEEPLKEEEPVAAEEIPKEEPAAVEEPVKEDEPVAAEELVKEEPAVVEEVVQEEEAAKEEELTKAEEPVASEEPTIASKIKCGCGEANQANNTGLIMLSSTSETCCEQVFESTPSSLVEPEVAPVEEETAESEVVAEEPAEEKAIVDEAVVPETSAVAAEVAAVEEPTVDAAPEPEVVADEALVPETNVVVAEEVEEETKKPEAAIADKEATEPAVDTDAPVEEPSSANEAKVEDAAAEETQVVAPEIAVTIPDGDAAEAEVETEAAPAGEIERPKSPWTPSYSVTSQGPGVTEEAAEPEPAVEEEVPATEESVEPTIPEVAVEGVAAGEATAQTWPVSYSVSSQGNSPMHKAVEPTEPVEPIQDLQDAEVAQAPVRDTVVPSVEESAPEVNEVVTEAQTEAPVEETVAAAGDTVVPPVEEFVPKDEAPVSDVAVAAEPELAVEEAVEVAPEEVSEPPKIVTPDEDPAVEPVAVAEEPEAAPADAAVEAAPEKTWVPSYSVSRQGSRSSLIDKEEPKEEPKQAEPEAAAAEDVQAPATVIVTPDVEEESATEAKETPAPVERPWTPSYSVSRQGSKSDLLAKDEPKAEEAEQAVEETPAPVVITSEPESTEAAPAGAEAEKPTWTPSYSVSRQGSRSSLAVNEVPKAEEPEQVAETPAPVIITSEPEPATEAKDETPAAVEAPARPWTPSYSVSRQGSRSSLVAKDEPKAEEPEQTVEAAAPVIITSEPEAAEQTDAPAAVEAPERPWTPSYSVSRQGTSPVPSPKVSAAELPAEQAAPERPWTPSYSVSRQGSSPMLTSKELAPAEEVSVPAVASPVEEARVETPVISVDAVEEPKVEAAPIASPVPERPWTPSYSVSQQGASPIGTPAVKPKELEEEVPAVAAPAVVVSEEPAQSEPITESTDAKVEQPERPWTPSYSVTTQGPASPSEDSEAAPKAFPTTEVTELGPKVTTQPSLARLAPVSENEQANVVSPAELDSVSPTAPSTTRTRHESTTSSQSRMLPGGWVSGTKSPAEDNRASLDHAKGEFSKTTPATPATPAPANTPAAPADEGHHHQKKKHRMCIIM